MFLLGGIETEISVNNSFECSDAMWYYNLHRRQWHFLEPTKASPLMALPTRLCTVIATGIGRNLVAVGFGEDFDRSHVGIGLLAYTPETNTWVKLTSMMPFHIDQLLSWNKKLIAVGKRPRKPDGYDEISLNIKFTDG